MCKCVKRFVVGVLCMGFSKVVLCVVIGLDGFSRCCGLVCVVRCLWCRLLW